jgi:hypothetical protein
MRWGVILALGFLISGARAEDWTICGKTYSNVRVVKVEDDLVSVTYDGGMGRLAIADLPPDVQKRFNYDPTKAKQAAQDRAAAQAQADAQVAAELAQQQKQQAADRVAASAPQPSAPVTQAAAYTPGASASPAPAQDPTVLRRIAWLRQKIADMQRQIADERGTHNTRPWTHGGLDDAIAADQQELAQYGVK